MATLVDESYVRAQLEAYNNKRLKFYCHHVTCYGTSSDGTVFAFSFDIIVPNVTKDISGLADFIYNRNNMRVPCSGIARSSDGHCYSCYYARIKENSDAMSIYTFWRHVNKSSTVADINITIPITSSTIQLSVWEV